MAAYHRVRIVTDKDGNAGQYKTARNGDQFGVCRGVLERRHIDPVLKLPVVSTSFIDLLGFAEYADLVAGVEPGQVISVAGDIEARPWTSRDGQRSGTSYSIVVRGVLDADSVAMAAD